MQKTILVLLIGLVVLGLILPGSALASGSALMLGAGQELRLDLPLEATKAYLISLELRTDLADAVVTMTLCQIRNNNEIIEYKVTQRELEQGGGWIVAGFPDVQIPREPGRWELVLTANQEGRYYWKNLRVLRNYSTAHEAQQYWSEKLATQGTFFTGLVVDARHLDVNRGISPRIYSESGQLLYGGVLAPQEVVQEQGVVAYGPELTPELLERLEVDGDYPYVAPLLVEAIDVADAARTGVYISEEDTRRVLEAMVQYDFFARYAVIFLVD